jgi:hypothetical protein
MQDCFERRPSFVVCKDQFAHCDAIKMTRFVDQSVAELSSNLIEGRLAGFDEIPGDRLATVDLPLAIPPVRPIFRGSPV